MHLRKLQVFRLLNVIILFVSFSAMANGRHINDSSCCHIAPLNCNVFLFSFGLLSYLCRKLKLRL